jgi:hypothetical protein
MSSLIFYIFPSEQANKLLDQAVNQKAIPAANTGSEKKGELILDK